MALSLRSSKSISTIPATSSSSLSPLQRIAALERLPIATQLICPEPNSKTCQLRRKDKQAVEAYNADIKAQLTRAGLIRRQPRSSMLQAQAATAGPMRTRSMNTHRYSAPATATNSPSSSPPLGLGLDFGFSINPYLDPHHLRHEDLLLGVPAKWRVQFNVHPPPELNFPVVSSQNFIQENYVMYYFKNVRSAHFLFAGNTTTNVLYSMIVQEPQGTVTNAVCALASLHFTRKRVAKGLEAPDLNPDHSTAKYFYDESYLQLANAQQIRGHYNETLDWLAQIGLPEKEEPKHSVLSSLSPAAQIAVKGTMWVDIFVILSLMRPPKHLLLYQRLLSHSVWSIDTNLTHSVSPQMETLSGCPDDVMLAIAEISALAHWKTMERIKGTLNYRDLIHRGDDIEQRLRQRPETPIFEEDPPLHPNLLQPSITDIIFRNQEVRKLLASIFRATALLYLHTVLHDSNPGVSDITASVNDVVQLVHQLYNGLRISRVFEKSSTTIFQQPAGN
ncbi:fungal-specific transcription factor domain-containing protein [Lentinula detonsa]|uniref:Fungal-specific transcription factor domain-containing protein n=1 Tax=Lentinula detonsa TaxID=2804962 RepID=A0AA38UNB0_9AGAR|nr:fungal-specific transcription factor domain-containing protein [Lentinula detonsa]